MDPLLQQQLFLEQQLFLQEQALLQQQAVLSQQTGFVDPFAGGNFVQNDFAFQNQFNALLQQQSLLVAQALPDNVVPFTPQDLLQAQLGVQGAFQGLLGSLDRRTEVVQRGIDDFSEFLASNSTGTSTELVDNADLTGLLEPVNTDTTFDVLDSNIF